MWLSGVPAAVPRLVTLAAALSFGLTLTQWLTLSLTQWLTLSVWGVRWLLVLLWLLVLRLLRL